MRSSERITLLGAMPPTIGGVSIHVERLADTLAQAGYEVRVFDLFSRADAGATKPYEVIRGRGWRTWLRLMTDGVTRRPAVTHVHLSGGRHLPMMVPFLWWTRLWSRVVFTMHSGGTAADMDAASPAVRALMRLGLRAATRIVCVNQEIRTYLADRLPRMSDRLCHIIPFIRHPRATRAKGRGEGKPVVLASGYGTPLYEWLTLIEACGDAAAIGQVQLVFYNTYDPDYFPKIEAACARAPGRFHIHRDLTPDAFAALLAGVDCFVRPTLTDGDSIAVREALAIGLPVIASDCVSRPEACRLFRTRDAAALRAALEAWVADGCPAPKPGAGCGGQALLALYAEVITGRHAAARRVARAEQAEPGK